MPTEKIDYLFGLQNEIYNQSSLPIQQLVLLSSTNKQWRSIPTRAAAIGLQVSIPMLVGIPLDKPLEFYIEVARSYFAKCKMTSFAVNYQMTNFATQDFKYIFYNTRCRLPLPLMQAHCAVKNMRSTIQTHQGRAFALKSVLALREELVHGDDYVIFNDGAMEFLDLMERFLKTAFVIVGRRVLMGGLGYKGTVDDELMPIYNDKDFD
jgi:hypothetical protein